MRMLKITVFVFIAVFNGFSQIPPGYYEPATGLSGTALQSALHNIIKNHTTVSYTTLFTYFQSTDANAGNVVWDMYSDIPGGTPPYVYHYNSGDECGNYGSEGDCYNREHSWPKSWFGGEVLPMYTDLFHLYPTDGYVNNRRDNYPYGEVSTATWTSLNNSKLGVSGTAGYSGTVFEPIDDYKGDFARTCFYMSTRYFTEDSGWPGSAMADGSQLKPWALQMMLKWSGQDPISQKEIDRNNAVYLIQNNRNPFIDHPEFVNEIWGYPVGIKNENRKEYRLAIYPNPASDICKLILPAGLRDGPVELLLISATGVKFVPDISKDGNSLIVNVQHLSNGIYFLVATGISATYHAMLIKE